MDNITDDEAVLNKAINYLSLENDDNSSYDEKVFDVMNELNNSDYTELENTIKHLGINYQ